MRHSGKCLAGTLLHHREEKTSNRRPCSGAGPLNGVRGGADWGFLGGSAVKILPTEAVYGHPAYLTSMQSTL